MASQVLAARLYDAARSLVTGEPTERPLRPRSRFPSLVVFEARPGYDLLTRLINLVASGLGLLCLSPFLMVVAVASKLLSPGPIFYRGARVGLDEKPFSIFKFRTMDVGTEEKIGARLIQPDEDPYTPLGRFLRKYRLDELPQLINVFLGQMNLVGPRPLRPVFLEQLKQEVPGYALRFKVRPGITGKAQVRGGYYTSPRHKLFYDGLYIQRRSVTLDLKLVVLTFVRVMTRQITAGLLLSWMLAVVVLVPASRHDMFVVSLGPATINVLYLLPIGVAVWLGLRRELLDGRIYARRTPVDMPLALFVCLALFSVFFSYQPLTTLRGVGFEVCAGFLVFYLVLNTPVSGDFRWRTAKLLTLLLGIVSMIGLIEFSLALLYEPGAAGGGWPRARSTLGNPLALAGLSVLTLPVALTVFLKSPAGRRRAFWGVMALSGAGSVLLTFSRAGLLAIAFAGLIYGRRLGRRFQWGMLVCGAVFALVVAQTGDPRFDTERTIAQAERVFDEQAQAFSWFSAKRLSLGVGARSYQTYVAERLKRDGRPRGAVRTRLHNAYLTCFVEHGLLGMGLLVLAVVLALRQLRRGTSWAETEDDAALIHGVYSGLCGYLVILFVFDGLYLFSQTVIFWGMLGYGMGMALTFQPGVPVYYRIVHFQDRL